MKIIKEILFKIRLNLADGYERAILYKKHLGVDMGDNVRITGKINFGSEPYLISIGNNVTLTQNIQLITHDGGVAVFRDEYPGLNVYGRIRIGDNVFIGANTTILPGVEIGDNVVIGACSVVTKNIPNNSVAVGVPCKILKSLYEYKKDSLKKGIIIKTNNKRIEIMQYLKELNYEK